MHLQRLLPAALLGLALLPGCVPPTPTPPTGGPGTAPAPEPARVVKPYHLPPGGKMLMMHYMAWYTTPAVRGAWGSHWTGHDRSHQPDRTGPDGLPDIWSHYHPLIGLYDSSDPSVIECHLLQMKLAGVDGVIVDWYGTSQTADYPQNHAATRAVFDEAGRQGMRFAACFEDRSIDLRLKWGQLQPAEVTNDLAQTFAWMQQEWFSKSQYLHIQGRPLFLTFGPIFLTSPELWSTAMSALPRRPLFFGLHHLWRQAGADGGFTWVHYEPWEGDAPPEQQILNRIREVFTYFSTNPAEVIVSAYPGFNDVYAHENHRELAHRGGATLRETLQVGMTGPWPIIQLVTWNDYGEGTMIEPTHEFGYTFLETVQAARRAEHGDAFPFTPDDLRLPARLLALRVRGGTPEADLQAAADLLNEGRCAEARAVLDRLGAP